jgi:hypothetical protein
MARELEPCGTPAAYRRHKRKGEPVDEACAEAGRTQKNARKDAERASSGAAVALAAEAEPILDDVDPLTEALDNLRIIRAALGSAPPHNTVAALTKRRDELVDRIVEIKASKPEVSVLDELTRQREARRAKTAG